MKFAFLSKVKKWTSVYALILIAGLFIAGTLVFATTTRCSGDQAQVAGHLWDCYRATANQVTRVGTTTAPEAEWAHCRDVNNTTGFGDAFIPTNTAGEWQKLWDSTARANPLPTGLNLTNCGGPTASITAALHPGSTYLHDITVSVGDTVDYQWSSTNGTNWDSTYTNSCDPGARGTWVAQTANGATSSAVQLSQAGCTYTITYTVTGSGGTTASDMAIVRVRPPTQQSICDGHGVSGGPEANGQGVLASAIDEAITDAGLTPSHGDGYTIHQYILAHASYASPSNPSVYFNGTTGNNWNYEVVGYHESSNPPSAQYNHVDYTVDIHDNDCGRLNAHVDNVETPAGSPPRASLSIQLIKDQISNWAIDQATKDAAKDVIDNQIRWPTSTQVNTLINGGFSNFDYSGTYGSFDWQTYTDHNENGNPPCCNIVIDITKR